MTNASTDLAVLEHRLSVERLGPYRRAMEDDLGAAIALYEWNAEAAAAFWATLGHVEVVVRNAMDEQLSSWSVAHFDEPCWYLDPGRQLSGEARGDIAQARARATRNGRPETRGRVVAELSMGFWRYLLAARYERRLWRTCLWRAFPGQGLRRVVHDRLADLHRLRNRIAHHEPVHNRPLDDLHRATLTVAGWVCPDMQRWMEARSDVELLLAVRPDARAGLRSRSDRGSG